MTKDFSFVDLLLAKGNVEFLWLMGLCFIYRRFPVKDVKISCTRVLKQQRLVQKFKKLDDQHVDKEKNVLSGGPIG